jgi:hypothetical protein
MEEIAERASVPRTSREYAKRESVRARPLRLRMRTVVTFTESLRGTKTSLRSSKAGPSWTKTDFPNPWRAS